MLEQCAQAGALRNSEHLLLLSPWRVVLHAQMHLLSALPSYLPEHVDNTAASGAQRHSTAPKTAHTPLIMPTPKFVRYGE